jgi:hypothetical protein
MTEQKARELLSIEENTVLTQRVVERDFRKTAFKYHPDKHITADKPTKAKLSNLFKAAAEAKTLLMRIVADEPIAVTADEDNYQPGGEGGGGGGAAADDANPAQEKPTSKATKQKKAKFPKRIDMVLGDDDTTDYAPIQFPLMKTGATSFTVTVRVELGTNLGGISTRRFLELILTIYIQVNQLNCQDVIRLAFPGGLPQQPITASTRQTKLALLESNNSFVRPLAELRLLTDDQFRALLDEIGLAWTTGTKHIEVDSREFSLNELKIKSGMGFLIIPDDLTSKLPAKNTRPTAVVETTTEIDLRPIGAYLNDSAWGDPAPAGIIAMRVFFNDNSRDGKILQKMRKVASKCKQINRTPERAPRWLENQSLYARANCFYGCLIAANNMNDVIRFVTGEADQSQALVPAAAAAGNGQ